jgi:hypothetical protein
MTDSPIKSSSYKEFLTACLAVGEDNVIRILSLIKESHITQIENIKEHIINHTTSRFELDNNFFRKKRVTYTISHNSICFAVLLFQLRKYFTLSYKDICRELRIREKNSIFFYFKKLNSFDEKDPDDMYYIKLISEIDSEIKSFVERTIKNQNNGNNKG